MIKRCRSNFFFDMAVANSIQISPSEELINKSSADVETLNIEEVKSSEQVRTGTALAGYTVVSKSMIGAGTSRLYSVYYRL